MAFLKKYKLIWSPQSLKDLKGIYRYISEELSEPQIALNTYHTITQAVLSLRYSPERFPRIYDFTNKDRNLNPP